jgi:hypothetical protein
MTFPLLRRLLGVLVLAVLVVAACVIVESCRKTVGLLSHSEMDARVKSADAVVQSVYDYRTRTGSWPKDNAFPELIRAAKPEYHWHYQYRGDDEPPFVTMMPAMHTLGTYRFPNYAAPDPEFANTWKFSGDMLGHWKPIESTAVASPR